MLFSLNTFSGRVRFRVWSTYAAIMLALLWAVIRLPGSSRTIDGITHYGRQGWPIVFKDTTVPYVAGQLHFWALFVDLSMVIIISVVLGIALRRWLDPLHSADATEA